MILNSLHASIFGTEDYTFNYAKVKDGGVVKAEFKALSGDYVEDYVGRYIPQYIYALGTVHPSSNIYYSGNLVYLRKLEIVDNGDNTISVVGYQNIETIGTFTGSSMYSMYYSYDNPPPIGYTRTESYYGTIYYGLDDMNMYPSKTIAELANKATVPTRFPSNTFQGLLTMSGNFWTNFAPNATLKTYLQGFA